MLWRRKIEMLMTLIALQILTIVLAVVLLTRMQGAQTDPRMAQLPDQLTRLDARNQALDEHIRNALWRRCANDIAAEAQRSREASDTAFSRATWRDDEEHRRTEQSSPDRFDRLSQRQQELGRSAAQGGRSDRWKRSRSAVSSFTSETNRSRSNLREAINTEAESS